MTFDELPLSPPILARLHELGFTRPTPIQAQALPHGLARKNVVGKAETGTGKTLAFALPIAEHVDPERKSPQALVLCPTRELARQVAETIDNLAVARGFQVATLVGGEPLAEQVMGLRKGCQVVVGTPGRVLDLCRQKILSLCWVAQAVLDEADRMLDMGFIDDVRKILDMTMPERQTLLFSATFPPELRAVAERYAKGAVEVETARGLATVAAISQTFIRVGSRDKLRLLKHVLDLSDGTSTLVFLNTKRDADQIGRVLWTQGYKAATLHGDYPQEIRDRVLDQFREGEVTTLVATDVAQRGLDIEKVSSVVNYGVPKDPEDYVHRIGRTGRAGRQGFVVTLVDETEQGNFARLQQRLGGAIRELGRPKHIDGWEAGAHRAACSSHDRRNGRVRGAFRNAPRKGGARRSR